MFRRLLSLALGLQVAAADLSTLHDPTAGFHPISHSSASGHHPASHAASGHHPASHSSAAGYAAPTAATDYQAPAEAKGDQICTDVSYVKPIEYVPGETCCTTKVVEPYCEEKVTKVTKEVTETVCELIPTPRCSMKSCPVDATYPENYEKAFEPWACELRPKTLYHFKTLPVCHNVSKPICIEEWKTDYSTGQRYKVTTDQCEHAFWEECEDQRKKVPFETMESQCWKDKEIWYETCKEVTESVNMMCWECEADAVPKCDRQTRTLTIDVPEKHCEPRTETQCDPPKKVPTQEKVHQEKCLNHSGGPAPAQYSPPPTYQRSARASNSSSAPSTYRAPAYYRTTTSSKPPTYYRKYFGIHH